jgi:lipid II:glycine glycyltransferase (peptidoglycan interpeptide bridge formation enzyme)
VTEPVRHPSGSDSRDFVVRTATEADKGAWHDFLVQSPAADPLQSWAWGDASREGGESPIRLLAEDADGKVAGAVQVLARPSAFGRQVLYAPHGPVWDRERDDAPDLLESLVEGLRSLARREHAIVAKVDPRAEMGGDPPSTPDVGQPAVGRPDVGRQLKRVGFRRARFDLQAASTLVVALPEDPDAIVPGLPRDTRNLVRRSEREGVSVDIDRDAAPEAMAAFFDLYRLTAERAGFRARPREFLDALGRGLAETGSWYLVLARREGRPIAGMVVARSGDRAFYLYGGSRRDPEFKHAYAPYAAMASAMHALAADGVRVLDLWGASEPGTPAPPDWRGFSAFKEKFGGVRLRHPGTFDLVGDPVLFALRDIREAFVASVSRWRSRAPTAIPPWKAGPSRAGPAVDDS